MSTPFMLRRVHLLLWIQTLLGLFSTEGATPVAAPAFQLAPGLRLETWATEPQLFNPVAFSFDEHGRAYVAESHRWARSIFDITKLPAWLETDLSFRTVKDRHDFLVKTYATNLTELTADSERISWVEDRDGDGRADASGILAKSGFDQPTSGTAAGILVRTGMVWFASIPELWKVETAAGGAEERERKALIRGFGVHMGVSGHDLHGLTWGPDGRLYFSVGDRGFHVEGAPDWPPSNAVHGGWRFPWSQPDSGAVFRCEPDGSGLEVVAVGLRNPQELTFDDQGNLWTGDNDTAGADDSRLLWIVEGGDYGWRCGYQHLPGFGPWVEEGLWRGDMDDVLPTSGLVSQGPAGFAFNPGLGLGEAWAGRFFMCDFPGGIWSFKVRAKGAGYEVVDRQKFLWNLWPTDIEFGVDGAAYVSDWVYGWGQPGQGRIYRLTAEQSAGVGRELKTLLATNWSALKITDVRAGLAHADLRVRREAQWELVRRGSEGGEILRQVAVDASASLHARLHGIWGMMQRARLDRVSGAADSERLTWGSLLSDSNPEIRAHAVRAAGEMKLTEWRDTTVALLQDSSLRVRLFAGIALGRLGGLTQLEPILAMVRTGAGADAFVRHGALMALLGNADAGRIVRLLKDRDAEVRKLAVMGLRRLQRPEIAQAFSDFDPVVIGMVGRAVHDVPINESMPALAAFLGKIDCPDMLLSRAINANFRLGEQRNATLLTAFAARADVEEKHRILALDALSHWAEPPGVDRVIGLWRPPPKRSAEIARRAFREVASKLDAAQSDRVRMAAMKVAARLRVKEVGHGYLEAWTTRTNSALAKVEILRTLEALNHSRMGEALELGLQSPEPEVKREAIRIAAERPSPTLLGQVQLLLASEKDLRIQQTLYMVLARMELAEADRLLSEGLRAWLKGDLPRGLGLELIEGARHRSTPEMVEMLKTVEQQYPGGDADKRWIPALEGGDALRGKGLFFDRADLQCQRCHQVGGIGGTVGPSLDGVGKRLNRSELVQSIVQPNARMAVGFEQVQIVMKDGRSLAGVVRREDERQCVVENIEDGMVILEKVGIRDRVRGLSAMPEGFDRMLTAREMRDLVEYLSGLR